MDAGLSRAHIAQKKDPHDWNSFDNYKTIHEERLAAHPFIDSSQLNTLEWSSLQSEGVLFLSLEGRVYCKRKVVLEVSKLFETRFTTSNILLIRGLLYKYIAWIPRGNIVLKYHNLHENPDEYCHRVFDPQTGKQIFYETLTRIQFPLFTEVLDEIELITKHLA